MNLLEETKFIMKKYNISANKKLGQNFLIDDNAISEIVNQSEISNSDLVIEIGPGLGTLTAILLEKAGKVIAIELDTKVLDISDWFTISETALSSIKKFCPNFLFALILYFFIINLVSSNKFINKPPMLIF